MIFRHKAKGWLVETENKIVQEQYIKYPDIWEKVIKKKQGKKKNG